MDLDARRAWLDGEPLPLSVREWDVLGYLLTRAGKVVAKEQIAAATSGWDQDTSDNAVEVCISRLRAKLDASGVRIGTVRGFGYLLEETGPAER